MNSNSPDMTLPLPHLPGLDSHTTGHGFRHVAQEDQKRSTEVTQGLRIKPTEDNRSSGQARGQQDFSVRVQIINILGFAGYIGCLVRILSIFLYSPLKMSKALLGSWVIQK